MNHIDEPPGFSRIAGRPSLDFANTVGSRHDTQPNERLVDFAALTAWGAGAGIIPAGRWPDDDALLRRAIGLRETLYRIFSAIAAGGAAAAADLAILNEVLREAELEVHAVGSGYTLGWAPPARPVHVLWAVARDAADLLTGPLLARAGECAGEHCGWLFLDESKNGSRRWCDMKDCGNRAKARRHYRRQRTP